MPKLKHTIHPERKDDDKLTVSPKLDESRWRPSEKWSVWISGITGIFVVAAAIIYGFQLQEMRKSTDASTKASSIAERAVGVAEKSLQASIDSSRIDQRAWVGIKDITLLPLEEGKPLIAQIRISNSGRTFAREVRIPGMLIFDASKIETDEAIKTAITHYQNKPPAIMGVIFPNGEILQPCIVEGSINSASIEAILADKLNVYIIGEIQYLDVFGQHHTTTFFSRYFPLLRTFQFQAKHNEAD